jgi:hypothetical protein
MWRAARRYGTCGVASIMTFLGLRKKTNRAPLCVSTHSQARMNRNIYLAPTLLKLSFISVSSKVYECPGFIVVRSIGIVNAVVSDVLTFPLL